jgi:hypothetical protein
MAQEQANKIDTGIELDLGRARRAGQCGQRDGRLHSRLGANKTSAEPQTAKATAGGW